MFNRSRVAVTAVSRAWRSVYCALTSVPFCVTACTLPSVRSWPSSWSKLAEGTRTVMVPLGDPELEAVVASAT